MWIEILRFAHIDSMKFAICCSSYLLREFVELNLNRLRFIFGDSPILVSDDRSPNSEQIEAVAAKFNAYYVCSRVRRNHFGGDLASIVNGLTFAEQQGADVFLKVSLRLILLDPQLRNDFTNYFQNRPIDLAVPQRLHPTQTIRKSGMGFVQMPLMTDILLIRVGAIRPQELIDRYRKKVTTEKVKHASFVEALFTDLKHEWGHRCMALDELSTHIPGQAHRYLRKVQNTRIEYVDTAAKLGIHGPFQTAEWSQIDGVNYRPRPSVV